MQSRGTLNLMSPMSDTRPGSPRLVCSKAVPASEPCLRPHPRHSHPRASFGARPSRFARADPHDEQRGWDLNSVAASAKVPKPVCLRQRRSAQPPAAWRGVARARLPSWAIFHSAPQAGGGFGSTPPGRRRDRKAHSATPKANKMRLSVRCWAADSGMSGCPRTSSTSSFALITFCQTQCPRRAQAPAAAAHQCYRDRTPQRSSRYVAR